MTLASQEREYIMQRPKLSRLAGKWVVQQLLKIAIGSGIIIEVV